MLELRNERIRRGWSQTRVSALTNIASPDLSAIERGTKKAYPGWRRRLAEAFQRSEEELFAEADQASTTP